MSTNQESLIPYIMSNMSENDRNCDVRRAQLRQVTLRRNDLNHRLTPKILVEILRHRHRYGQVLGALDDMARDGDAAEKMSEVEREYGPEHT